MVSDSTGLDWMSGVAAVLLFGTALFAWGLAPNRARLYLRFAAMLFAALAIAVVAQVLIAGLADAAALIVLPLGGISLGLFALARFGKPLPSLVATCVLVFSLAGALAALLGGNLILAMAPLALGGVAVIFAALHRLAFAAAFSGALLFVAACAFMIDGAGRAVLSLLAAGLFGLASQTLVSNRAADFPARVS